MIKYNNTNNASTTLTAGISASSTTLIVENGDILPTAPFLLTLEHFDNEKVTVREIVKCVAKAGNILTIQRGAGTCVQDDSASTKEQGNSAHSFSVGDCASIYWTSEQVQDIQNEIEKKLNIDDFQAGTYVYGATSTGTDAYSITIPGTLTSYAVGQVFRFMADVDNEGNATLNINGLGAVEIRKNHDIILDSGDIEAGQIVEVAYDGTYFQMDSQVATVVDLGNIDSLKMSGVVGELYTLDDELYLQDVSEDLDLTQPVAIINVGYDKEETHIQRIANGISGNSISLYIAKVGSPVTNFTVEIRKGIYAEADGRAYWTGDENEIIASKSISYSSFTTDFQKITITFDDDIELQRGELIDIVCYQSGISDEKIKSTTNYFIIGGYGDKLGEGNSVNYVDNNVVTKLNHIAYCSSLFFVNKTLSKVSTTMQEYSILERVTSTSGSKGMQNAGIADLPSFNYTNNRAFSVFLNYNEFPFSVSGKGTGDFNIEIYSNGTWQRLGTAGGGRLRGAFWEVAPGETASLRLDAKTYGTLNWAVSEYMGVYSSIEKQINGIGRAPSVVPVGGEINIITEGNVNGERYQQPTIIPKYSGMVQKKQGQIYYNTSTGKLMFCNGTKRGEVTVTYPS